MEDKKQETAANDEEEKESRRGSFANREQIRCQTAKEEFLGVKLLRRSRVTSSGGAHTPVPTWKTVADVDLMTGEVGAPSSDKARRSSARQLGASLWEIQNLEIRNSALSGRRSGTHRQRDGKEIEEESAIDDLDRPRSSASLMRHIKERTRRAPLPESPASYSSSIGAAAGNPSMTPSCSSEILKPSRRDPRYGLKTSTELLKVLNRIWTLEEQQNSHVSLVKSLKLELHQAHSQIKDLEGLLRKVSDEKLVKKLKEKEKREKIRVELEMERKLRKNSESLGRKLGKEFGELKGAFLKSVKDLEKEKKVNSLLEDLCDEFAKGIRVYEEKIRVLQQAVNNNNNNNDSNSTTSSKDYGHKFDRVILHIAEAWLDERMQMQLAEKTGDQIEKATIVEKLSGEIKSFKTSCSKNEDNTIINGNNGNFRRQSLESVHLNGNSSAPRVLEEEDEEDDSIASDLHCFELDMYNNNNNNNNNNGKVKLDFSDKILPRNTYYEDSPKIGNRGLIIRNRESRKSYGEINLLDSCGQFCKNSASGEICVDNPEISVELPPGVRENTLKAKLIQARLEGRQARLRGSSVRK